MKDAVICLEENRETDFNMNTFLCMHPSLQLQKPSFLKKSNLSPWAEPRAASALDFTVNSLDKHHLRSFACHISMF